MIDAWAICKQVRTSLLNRFFISECFARLSKLCQMCHIQRGHQWIVKKSGCEKENMLLVEEEDVLGKLLVSIATAVACALSAFFVNCLKCFARVRLRPIGRCSPPRWRILSPQIPTRSGGHWRIREYQLCRLLGGGERRIVSGSQERLVDNRDLGVR